MKLLKKLLPVATVAATATIVAPMVTSCSKTILTNSKLDFKPDQHDQVEGGLSEEEAIKELCSNSKYIAQEIAYYAINEGLIFTDYIPFTDGHKEESDEFIAKYNNATYEFTTSIKNVSLSEKTAKIQSTDVKGYLLSAEITDEVKAKGEEKTIKTTGVTKIVNDYSQKTTYSLKDIFVYVKYDTEYEDWEIYTSALKAASENWSFTRESGATQIITTTYKDGHETTDRSQDNIVDHELGPDTDDVPYVIEPIDSYYLANIKKKA